VAAPVFSEIASGALRRMAVAPANPVVERASLLPIGNVLGFFSAPDNDAYASNPVAVNSRGLPGLSEPYPAESAAAHSADNHPRVPDFRGLSLRSALALARTYELAVAVTGSGYVVSQQPEAGAAWPHRSSNSAQPKASVQILLAAPGQSAPQGPPPLAAYLGPAAAPRVPAAAGTLMAGASRFSRKKPEVRPLAFAGNHRGRSCRNGSEIRTRCIAQ